MSNPLAILAVTTTLRRMLSEDDALSNISVRPPDRLLDNDANGRLNLYLYRVAPNASWQNSSMPDRVRGSEASFPPLALDLYYLLTAYGDESEQSREHELLCRAMSILHNNASISPEYVRSATSRLSGGEYISDLHQQIERIRVTHEPLSVDDLSKLWNTFQTQYRISTAYRVSVVLIDSRKRAGSALPVLRRGEADQGVRVFVGLDPRLERIIYRHNQRDDLSQLGATIGGRVALFGTNLPADGLTITIRDPRVPASRNPNADVVAVLKPLPPRQTNLVEFDLSEGAAEWRAGVYAVEVSFEREGIKRTSNQLPFAIAPEIRKRFDGHPIMTPFREEEKNKLQIEIINGIPGNRKAFLILNGAGGVFQLLRDTESKENSPESPVFDIDKVPTGAYRLRIRVDGVDSFLTTIQNDSETPFFEFDPQMKVMV